MPGSGSSDRYGPLVQVPELTGRADAIICARMQAIAQDPELSPEQMRRERDRIVAEQRQEREAERARQAAAVEMLTHDVAAAVKAGREHRRNGEAR